MTDMEAKARELWSEFQRESRRATGWAAGPGVIKCFQKYLTEAHNAGYESAWKPTEEWKRLAAEGEFNRGMEEAAKVMESIPENQPEVFIRCAQASATNGLESLLAEGAAAIREKIKC